ncbi:MAG: histidinol-phosphate transaminase [Caldilineales bacterium]|nr:histidinol-phosphate transaminase [Caldilineales bacterium]MDW8316601.1 histidinol-phosphate transaminase [Anaerolineae bacterium]
MSQEIKRLIRPELAGLEPYVPIHPFEVVSRRLGRPPEQIVKLDANENPYGPSPRAVEAIVRYPWLHIYPDPQSTELREALADYLGVPADRILVGNGADELIDLIGRLVLSPGDAMLDCPPTFGMYALCAAVNGAHLISVPRRPDFSLDVDAIERLAEGQPAGGCDRPKLLFLCSPNNPDGGLLPAADLERLLRLPLLVVVDEAYIEFARPGASFVPWVAHHPNLAVLRTFSKWAGLGGLRVGYGVFPPAIAEQLWKIKPPYNVNVAGSRAALASLADREYLLSNVARLVAERERLYAELARFPFLEPVPGSQSNFVLCRVLDRDARQLKLDLEEQGVLVRHFAKPGVDNCLRISVGRPEQTDALVEALCAMV